MAARPLLPNVLANAGTAANGQPTGRTPDTEETTMSNTATATLLELLSKLFGGDEELRNEFLDNPDRFIEKYELEDLSCDDFNEAILAFVDNHDGGEYNLGGKFYTDKGEGKFYADKDEHDGDDHEAVKTVIKKIVEEGDTYHVTHNYDNDTVYDNSFKGDVYADGDVRFDNDITVAEGDGAVAAGDDITGDVATGDNNFNEGTIVGGDQVADDGGAIAGGEDSIAVGNNEDNDDFRFEDNSTEVDVDVEESFNDSRDQSDNRDQSFEQEVNVEETDDTAVVTNP
jgi:hypothetical protein